jgi:hypothetical protein
MGKLLSKTNAAKTIIKLLKMKPKRPTNENLSKSCAVEFY